MYTSGWIPFYRDELNDSLFEDPKWLQRWLWLCTRAAYKPCRRLVGATHRAVEIQPGQIVTTKAYLSRIWGINFRTVMNFLDEMEMQGRLTYAPIDNVKGDDASSKDKISKSNLGIIITLPLRYVFPPKAAEGKNGDEVQDGLLDRVHDEPQALLQDEAQAERQEGLQVELQTNKGY